MECTSPCPEHLGSIVKDERKIHYLMDVLARLVLEDDNKGPLNTFPGSYGVPVSRRDLQYLTAKHYWVTDWSKDAFSCMLLSIQEGAFLVSYSSDEDVAFYGVEALNIPVSPSNMANQHMTLLDGAIVLNHQFNRPCFMVSDIVAFMGNKCPATLTHRFEYLRKALGPYWNKYQPSGREADPALPFMILGQEFESHKKVKSFLDKFERHEDELGPRYIFHNRHRYHDTSGVMFVPDEGSWNPWKNTNVKCWTWPDLESVKFLVRLDSNTSIMDAVNCNKQISVTAYVTDTNGELAKYCNLELLQEDFPSDRDVVASFSFEIFSGSWKFNRMTDGDPTFILDVAAYLEKSATSVTRAQIEKSVLQSATTPVATSSKPRMPSRPTIAQRTSPNVNTPSNTSSSSTPSGSTPGSYSSSTPGSDYTPPFHTPSMYSVSPYISPPQDCTPPYDDMYDSPLDRTSSNNINHCHGDRPRVYQGGNSMTRKRSSESISAPSSSHSGQAQKRYKR